jgi:hypothetical protein
MKHTIKSLLFVAVLAASGFAQSNTADVPVIVNVDATVSIQPPVGMAGASGTISEVKAGQETVLTITLEGASSVLHRAQRQTGAQASFNYSRGGISLDLHPQTFKNAEIALFSVSGKRILRGKASASDAGGASISRANIAKGVYLLSVKSADGGSFAKRLTHSGGRLNISVTFGGNLSSAPLGKQAADYGTWTITASAPGYAEKLHTFDPVIGTNPLQTITLEQGASCADIPSEAAVITFNGTAAPTVSNPYGDDNLTVTSAGAHVTVRSVSNLSNTGGYNIVLRGAATDGSLKFRANGRIREGYKIFMDGADITSKDGPALTVFNGQNTDIASIILVCGKTSRLVDGATYDSIPGEQAKGALFSEARLVISGDGTLEVSGKRRHAITVDNSFAVTGGALVVKESTGDGIHVNEDILISGGTVQINSTGDAIQAERDKPITISGGKVTLNTTGVKSHGLAADINDVIISGTADVKITASGNGGKGIRCRNNVSITGGTLDITTSGTTHKSQGEVDDDEADSTSNSPGIKVDGSLSMSAGNLKVTTNGNNAKGLNVGVDATITGGSMNIDAYDDGMKIHGTLVISGGTHTIKSRNRDAIDAAQYTPTFGVSITIIDRNSGGL